MALLFPLPIVAREAQPVVIVDNTGAPLSGSNASVGADNATAPTSSTQIGAQDGSGKLQALQVDASSYLKVNVAAGGGGAVTMAAGAVAAGAYVSGSVLSGAYASGALVDVLATNTLLEELLPTPGETNASITGAPVVQGFVTTGAPTYTTGQINALSLTTAGGLRVDGSGVIQGMQQADLTTTGTISAAQPVIGTPVANATVVLVVAQGQATWKAQLLAGTGGFTGGTTLVADKSLDGGTTWFTANFKVGGSLTNTPVQSITGPGPLELTGNCAGVSQVRIRCTVLNSTETIAVTLRGGVGTGDIGLLSSIPTGSNVIGHILVDSGTLNVAQQAALSVSGTLQAAATGTGAGTPLALLGNASIMITVSGSFTGLVMALQGSEDGTTYSTALSVTQLGTSTILTSITAAGLYECSVAGLQKVQANVSAIASGNVTVTAHAVPLAFTTRVNDITDRSGRLLGVAVTNADTTIGGTTAPAKGLLGIGKSNDGTPQYQPTPLGAAGRSVIVEGYAGGTAQPVSLATLPALAAGSAVIGALTANQSVNVAQVGTAAYALGANTVANSQPITNAAVQGWIAATGTGTASQDDAFTFASQVRKVVLYNAAAVPVPFEFDTTAAATSLPIQPGQYMVFDDVLCTVVHVFPSATLPLNTTAGLYVKGWK